MEETKENTQETTQETTQVANTAEATTNEESKNAGKTFTQEDVNAVAQKVRKEEQLKTEKLITEAVNNALQEYERTAKLSAEERERENKTKKEKELAERENAIIMRERTIEAHELLQENGIDKDLAKFVVSADTDKMKENIEELVKVYNKSVETSVQDKLKGQPPKDFSGKTGEVPKKLSGAF